MDIKDYLVGRGLVLMAIDNSVLTDNERMTTKAWLAQVESMLINGDVSIADAVETMQKATRDLEAAIHQRQPKYDVQTMLNCEQIALDIEPKIVRTRTCWFYPKIRIELIHYIGVNATISPARYLYMHTYGAIPENSNLQHTCRNSRCINPKHMKLSEKVAR